MDLNKLTIWIVGLVIGSLLLVGLLFPAIDAATNHDTTFNNKELAISYIDDSNPVAFSSSGVATDFYVNGEKITALNATFTTVTADTFAIRSSNNQLVLLTFPTVNAVLTYTGAMNLTASNGVLSGTVGDQEINQPYTYAYYLDPHKSDYVMTNDLGAYVHGSDRIYCDAYNATLGTGSANRWLILTGSINEGFELKRIAGDEYEPVSIDYEKIEGYEDLYLLKSIKYEISDTEVTISRFIAPADTIATKIVPAEYDELFKVIPLLGIITLVVYASVAIRSKY